MAYRNGTYIAFHAEGSSDPTVSDIKYYRMMKAWHEHDAVEFCFVNSHEKVSAVRDGSQMATIKRSLRERLDNSKNMILIVGERTKFDTDFVPYEIAYAVDTCRIPLIVTYVGYDQILHPSGHRDRWPKALADRIDNQTVNAIHVPFKRVLIDDAMNRYGVHAQPEGPLVHFTKTHHQQMGIKVV